MSDQAWLETATREGEATAGTVHRVADGVLRLTASVNIPPVVRDLVATIPHGKGMAGLAWSRDAPVETCDLQTDETGDVRPGAKAVDAHAAVALPVHDAAGAVRAVVGFAYHDEREPDLARLASIASALPPEGV